MVRLTHITAQLEHGSQERNASGVRLTHITAQLEHGSQERNAICAAPRRPKWCYDGSSFHSEGIAHLLQHLQALVQHVLLFLFGRWRDVGIGCWWSSHLGVSPIASLAFCGALVFLELIVLAQFRLLHFGRLWVVERVVVAALAPSINVQFVRWIIDDLFASCLSHVCGVHVARAVLIKLVRALVSIA